MIKISIIVPVYNSSNFLSNCIDSILSQSYADFELIIVDDGSKDLSPHICDQYAASDERVVVIHKENSGVSATRNVGLDIAKGEWICFVDSDDRLRPHFLEELIANEENGIDLIVGGFHEIGDYSGASLINSKRILDFSRDYEILDIDPSNNKGLSIFYYPWGKLFRTSTIASQKLRFSVKMKLAEDFTFLLAFASQAKKAVLVPANNYEYRRFKNASCKYAMSFDEFRYHVEEFDNAINAFNERRHILLSVTRRIIRRSFFYNFFRYMKEQERNDYTRSCNLFNNNYGIKWLLEVIKEKSIISKIYIIVCFLFPRLGFYIIRK